jgi:tetratricopeptide (TPR) repeat protein
VSANGQAIPTNDVKDRQRLQSAAELAAQSAREEPENFDAQIRAAAASLEAGEAEDAIDFLTRANKLRPGDLDTLVKLGDANLEARRYDVAERWYKEALAKKPDNVGARSDLGLSYFLREPPQAEKAVAEMRRALEYDPGHIPTLHNLTLVLAKTGDFGGAEAALERLSKINPQSPSLPQLREELDKARRDPSAAGAQGGGGKKSPTD